MKAVRIDGCSQHTGTCTSTGRMKIMSAEEAMMEREKLNAKPFTRMSLSCFQGTSE